MADPLEQACSFVGRFQYHFGRLEQKIDQAVIKLLDLDNKAGPIVTGSVDFARKVNFVRTAANEQRSLNDEDKDFAERTCKKVFEINNARQIVIHSSFEPADNGGVQFKRTVAKDGQVQSHDQAWNDEEFSKQCSKMKALEVDFDKLIQLIKPVEVPNFGWYMPLSDMTYRNTPLPLRVAAMNTLVDVPWFPGKDDPS
jgi:hypothetical protein